MKIAIISFSSIVARKVLPAFQKLNHKIVIDVYVRREFSHIESMEFPPLIVNFKNRGDFDNIRSNYYDFVYVSSSNDNHSKDLDSCLESHHHTLIDKPAFLNSLEYMYYINEYMNKGLYLQEVVTWTHHAQTNIIKRFINNNISFHAIALFLIPTLKADNFRVLNITGSGVFHDMNAYAFSLANLLGIDNSELMFNINDTNYPSPEYFIINSKSDSKHLHGVFGFGFPYCNSLTITTDNSSISSDRIFTSDISSSPSIREVINGREITHNVVDDSFYNYIYEFIKLLERSPNADGLSYDLLRHKYTSSIFS